MKCYVFKVRRARFCSKTDKREKSGFNIALLSLEGAKFHLETFLDSKDQIFANDGLRNIFKPGFWDIDIDEFEVYTPSGSQYVKKVISINKSLSLEECKCCLDT